MIVKILGNPDTLAYQEAERVVKACGCAVWNDSYYYIDVAIAPLLTEKVSEEGLKEPIYGVLIFHPSIPASVWPGGLLDTVGIQEKGAGYGGHLVLGRQRL